MALEAQSLYHKLSVQVVGRALPVLEEALQMDQEIRTTLCKISKACWEILWDRASVPARLVDQAMKTCSLLHRWASAVWVVDYWELQDRG
jgi:hypothetical protein